MLAKLYMEYIYQIEGEKILKNPISIFDNSGVYLLIDKDLKQIWIWAGSRSKLFHRYIASSWAGKLRSRKMFYNFKYDLVKEGFEPDNFVIIYNEIIEGRTDLKYPGESRTFAIESKMMATKNKIPIDAKLLSKSDKGKISKIVSEVVEMQMHMKYTIDHIGKRMNEIKKIISK